MRDARTSAEDLELLLRRYADAARGGSSRAAVLFACLGRGRHLYGEPDHDTQLFRRFLADLPLGGVSSNGEIGPIGGRTRVHGYTSSFGIFRPGR